MNKLSIRNKTVIRILSFVLSLVCIAAFLPSCSERVTSPVLEHGDQGISLAMYEFLLSRMKGTLARNKYDVQPSSDFWTAIHPGTELTNEEYYNSSILDSCRNYLAAQIIFEREGLSLSEATLAEIDEEISFYIDYDGDGSQEKLDEILANYGVTADELKRIYIIEEKYKYLISSLYGSNGSLIADTVKDEYYRENYYRYKQILVSNFYYEYQRDEQGNVIYFDSEDGEPLYDTKNGIRAYDKDGNWVRDKHGNPIYYDADGKTLYDEKNGYPSAVLDEKGEAVKYYYTDEQMAERESRMNELLASVGKGNFSAFEAQIPNWSLFERDATYYDDGYYLSRIESSAYEDYMFGILEMLENMEIGEIAVYESEYGHHVIMKYELDAEKYSDSDYAEWFSSFNSSLINKLFLDKCKDFYGDITVNSENLSKARSIKNMGKNFDY